MSLTIQNPETEKLAGELATLTNQSLGEAVAEAVRRTLEEEKRLRGKSGLAEELLAIGRRCAPHLDGTLTATACADELFDDLGLPK